MIWYYSTRTLFPSEKYNPSPSGSLAVRGEGGDYLEGLRILNFNNSFARFQNRKKDRGWQNCH